MKRVVLILSIALLTNVNVWGQATAQISGAVKDQSGAVLPGVEVTATQTDTGIARSAVTNETGTYILPNLPVGPYKLEAALPGFRTYVQTGIVLQVNSSPAINVVLEVGQVTEQVEVQANAAMVETRAAGVGQVIENEKILDLPLNGRNATELIVLAGAAVQTAVSNPDRAMPGATAMSVAGGFSTGVTYALDGAWHNDRYNNYNLPFPFPDALQEFKVETSSMSAQSGGSTGASVNSVTKSGTNDFHGSAFEFVRNDLFNARNYFATTNSTLKRNQFGGTVGGPIRRNKLFFFGGIQGTTVRQDPADLQGFVPTAAMLTGDFSGVTAPQCRPNRQQLNLRAPFVNNRIDPSRFSKAARNLTALLPKPIDDCGLVRYGKRTVTDEHQYVARVDYQMSDAHSLFGRYLATKFKQPAPFDFGGNYLTSDSGGYDNLSQSYAAGSTYLLGPNTVNSLRVAVNRTFVLRKNVPTSSARGIGVNQYSYPLSGGGERGIRLNVSGGFTLGATPGPGITNSYQLVEDISLIRGAHQMNVGLSVIHSRNNFYANPIIDGDYAFNGQTSGLGLADFLLGLPSRNRQAPPSGTLMSSTYLASYIADTWKVTPRFTANLGVRWEPFIPQTVRNGTVAIYSEERYKAGVKSTVFKNAPFGFYYPGDPGFPNASCRPSGICKASAVNNRWGEFAPRLGFAWDPKGDGRMSIRAGVGGSYEVPSGGWFNNSIAPPWMPTIIRTDFPSGLDDPWAGYPGGNPFPLPPIDVNAVFPPDAAYYAVAENSKPLAKYSWNLSLQRQMGTDWLVSGTYMGSQASHLWGNQERNPAVFIPGNCGAGQFGLTAAGSCSNTGNLNPRRKLFLDYPNIKGTTMANISQYIDAGTSSYHGMLLSVQRRAARGVTLGANYTWSHCYGDDANLGGGGGAGSSYTDPNNRRLDRGNCEGDRRHVFNLTSVAQTPTFANNTLRMIATGWRVSGIYRKSSGSFLTITSGVDRALTGVSGQRAQQLLLNPYGDKSLTNYLNPSAFGLPALGALGNMGPRNIAGPGTWQFDLALSRSFQIRENQRLEARAEAYNVTNSLRPDNPATGLNSNLFGTITSSKDPRIMQFALKYVF
jgi:carboxypeptidase family protein